MVTSKQPRRLSLSRSLSILLALAAIGAAGIVFEEKRQASSEARDVAKLKRKIDAEREKISELKAEWSMLDQPARLQKIVELHPDALPLEMLKTEQIGTIDDVPWPPPPPAPKEGANGAAKPPAGPLAATASGGTHAPASEPAWAPAGTPAPMPLGEAADEVEETTFSPEVDR